MKKFIIYGKDDLVVPVDLESSSVIEELDAMAAQGFKVLSDSCVAISSEEALSTWREQLSSQNNYDYVLTSTTHIIADGFVIEKNVGIVTSTVVGGTNILRDVMAEVSNVVGGQSKTYMNKIESIKEQALFELRRSASEKNCNAIIGIQVDVDQVSGGGKSMFMVTAFGTAVVANKVE